MALDPDYSFLPPDHKMSTSHHPWDIPTGAPDFQGPPGLRFKRHNRLFHTASSLENAIKQISHSQETV